METLTMIQNLAIARYEMGELPKAVTLLREAIAGLRRVLGEEHPQTRQAVKVLRMMSEAL